MSTEYAVVIEEFANTHFIKTFSRKYKKAWDITIRAIVEEVQRMDALIGMNSYVETITAVDAIRIVKMEFRVAGTNESRRRSGNRCIVALHTDTMTAFILLVYGKTDVRGARETDWWKNTVRQTYARYAKVV